MTSPQLLGRRSVLTGAAALGVAATGTRAETVFDAVPPLKSITPYPLGVAVKVSQLDDPTWVKLATPNFSRVTPEWEMKMEYLLQADHNLHFDRADRIVDFAHQHGMSVHGHTLIWYALEGGDHFTNLAGKPDAFLDAYVGYITSVMQRYAGRIRSWDVVNEPVRNDGSGLRDCLWSKVLGNDYIGLALEAAKRADPGALRFINDYNLELTPKKRSAFLKMCERLLKDGAPLQGIGTQTHIAADISPQAIRDAMKDIASLGLLVHVSEVDISLQEDHPANLAQPLKHQISTLNALLSAYHDVPAAQRYGLTLWGLRDSDSWINYQKNSGVMNVKPDEPLLFDALGRPKPLTRAFVRAVK